MRLWLWLILSAALVGAVYGNSIHNGFHFDDGHSIQDNAYLRDLRFLPDYFTDVRTFSPLAENRSYRPALLIGYALSHALGGGAPWAYHLGSLLLHALGAWVLGLLARRLLTSAGFGPREAAAGGGLAGALFAVHPLLSETVNYLSARSSLQGAVLAFSAVYLYVEARHRQDRRWLLASLVTLAAALLTKLTAITAPALMVAWELLLGPDRDKLRQVPLGTWARRVVPFAALTVALTVLHETLVGAYARGARSSITPWSHLLTQTRVWMRYQALFIWPEDLCADLTMRWSESPLEGPTARAILFVIALATAGWALRRRLPLTVFGLVWFYVTLSPTNSVVPLSEPATEHRVYIAAPGLILALLELGLHAARRRGPRPLLIVLTCAAFVGLGARTVARNRVWQDDVTLWGSVLSCAPDNGRAHLNYGRGLLAAGDVPGARAAYAKCAALWPGYTFCPINQAALELQQGDVSAADGFAARALALQPKNVYAQYWRGLVDLELERFEPAARAFEGALEVAPGFADAERGLGRAYFELGRLDDAQRLLGPHAGRGALGAEGWFAWGFLRARAEDPAGARAAYDRALTLTPEHRRARYNRGLLAHQAGQLEAALVDYRALAQAADPSPDLLYNLTLAELRAGHLAEARRARDRLAAAHPTYPGLSTLDAALDASR